MKNSQLKKRLHRSILLGIVVLILFSISTFAQKDRQLVQEDGGAGKRTALVIGNGDYDAVRKLSNPVNDANDMANSLREIGFEVIVGTNLSLKQLNEKVREFGDKLKASGGVGLFYYAGHGIQVNNRNYLIPVEANILREDEIDYNALNFDRVLQKMATANNGLNIVILDACRNNPFARSWSRSASDEGGLAQISAPTGTFIAYATAPDRTASDGEGRNGLYTSQLLKFIKQPNLKIEEVFKQVTISVDRASDGKQTPWTSSSLRGDFYFMPANAKFSPVKSGGSVGAAKAGTIRKNSVGMEFVYLSPGTFMMGSTAEEVQAIREYTKSPQMSSMQSKSDSEFLREREQERKEREEKRFFDEMPQRRVRINEGFWIGRYEVTQAQWEKVMGGNPSELKNCGKNCAVENVSWYDAQKFIKALNDKNDGFIYSLPSEAEWEYAARAGTTTVYSSGNLLTPQMANVIRSYSPDRDELKNAEKNIKKSDEQTTEVGRFQPNAFGLYDMHGNVAEWCADIYHPNYADLPADGSANTTLGKIGGNYTRYVIRGGNWQAFAENARSANRGSVAGYSKFWGYGFRVVARLK